MTALLPAIPSRTGFGPDVLVVIGDVSYISCAEGYATADMRRALDWIDSLGYELADEDEYLPVVDDWSVSLTVVPKAAPVLAVL